MTRFARASLGSLVTLGFGLLAGIFINRLLGVEGRAAYALAVRTAGVVVAVAQWGIPEVMLGSLGRGGPQSAAVIGSALSLAVTTSLVLGAACLALAPLLAGSLLQGLPSSMLGPAVASSIFSVAYIILRRVIQLRGMLLVYNALDLLKAVVFLTLIVLIVLWSADQWTGAITAYLIAEAILTLLAGAFVLWRLDRFWKIDPGVILRFVRSGFLVQIGIIAMFLAGQAGLFVINVYLTLADVGYYATALGLATYVTFVSVSIRSVLQARLPNVGAQRHSVATLTATITRHTFIWLLVAAAGLGLIGKPLIMLLYGVEFSPAYLPMLYLLPGMVCWGLQQILASYFNALSEFRVGTLGAWIVAIVGIGLQIAATPILGVTGAAAALSLGYATALSVYVILFCRHSGFGFLTLLPSSLELRSYLAMVRRRLNSDSANPEQRSAGAPTRFER